MPKPSDYTPARRRMMQLIMVLILAGTIAIAAAVARSARRAHRVELSDQAITAREVTVRLPQGWRSQPGGGAGTGAAGAGSTDPGLVAEAIEAASGDDEEIDTDAARTITIRVERLRAPMSPIQYLFSNYEPAITGPRQRRVPEDWLLPIPVAGRSGIMMTAERGPRTRGRSSGGNLRKEIIATTVLPSLRAVVVHLQGMGEADASDRAIVKQIAAEITLANEPELGHSGEVVTLVDGIRFTTPPRFAAVPETDPNRTDRRLWPAPAPGRKAGDFEVNWQSVETVGCLCPDFDAADPKQVERAKATMATLLLVREPLWRFAEVTSIGKNVWRADPPKPPRERQNSDGGGGGVTTRIRAFLMTDPSGRALLTIVRGGSGDNDLNEPWNQIAPTVQFLPAADVASLEDIGTSEASRLRRAGYERLLSDRDVEWWLWTSNDTFIGWSIVDFPGAAVLAGKKQAHLRLPDGERVSHVVHDFSYRDVGPQYVSTITRDLAGPNGAAHSVQKTSLETGNLARSFDKGGATTVSPPQPAPPQFVPGALLPLLIGQLSRDPMLLQTDSFPGPEGIGPPQLLALIIRPAESTTRTTTRAGTADAAPLRCVTVQVNGAGSLSRWYFRKTGELETVEWPGGLKQIASDQNVVKNNFPKESGMAPGN